MNISNAERAKIAENENADVFVRIHANSSDKPADSGALTICMAPNNPYCTHIYKESRSLSYAVLEALTVTTGAGKLGVWETNDMSGINWASMPVTIIEMGFMSNEKEDQLMATADYQAKMLLGIANGIDMYLNFHDLYFYDSVSETR